MLDKMTKFDYTGNNALTSCTDFQYGLLLDQHSPIIKVDFKKFMYKILKRINYDSRKNFRRILESKRNYRVLEAFPLYRKGSLVSVLLCNSYLMAAR